MAIQTESMAHAIFIQNPKSIYKDRPGVAYHFPRRYLRTVQECVGDWVIFYEGKAGALGYVSVQRVKEVTPDDDPAFPNHFYAWLDPWTEWSFERIVPRQDLAGRAFERSLRAMDGRPMSGGANVSAVRKITPTEFAAIVQFGLSPMDNPNSLPRQQSSAGFEEGQEPFKGDGLEYFRDDVLTSRKARDESFARQVKEAYNGKCAISGLDLRNGGGRAEVQAAHIRPVKDNGPDTVPNGLALSGTLHWMFDRGLISVSSELRILISHNKVPPDVVDRLISPEQELILPENPRYHPHPEYLKYHREEVFGRLN